MGVAAKAQPILRAALYARFSSDIQKDRSIEDQFTELERAVKRLGFKIDKRHYYADRGVSATSLFERPGLTRDLLGAAQRGEIDVVLVEATDRLARSRADTFYLADRFKFHNVKLFTPAGEVSDLQLTFEGHSNEDFIKKLSMRVKRGHNALTREGRFAGGRCYGYDQTPGTGERKINEEQAKVLRRIFTEYASGIAPRKICAGLERDSILSPTGKKVWNYQGIVGGDGTGTGEGLLHRELSDRHHSQPDRLFECHVSEDLRPHQELQPRCDHRRGDREGGQGTDRSRVPEAPYSGQGPRNGQGREGGRGGT